MGINTRMVKLELNKKGIAVVTGYTTEEIATIQKELEYEHMYPAYVKTSKEKYLKLR
jgi:hypothetical protein